MKRLSRIIILIVVLFSLGFFIVVGCTENRRARSWGGSATENLPTGKKLVMVTWKESNLWILTRDMREGEKPEIYELKEHSSWGVMQGKVIIKESK